MEILEFLENNSGAFSVIFTAIVAISTFVYAILTWKLVGETRSLRKVQTDPQVSVFIQHREEFINIIDMVIKNIGLGPAYDITFELDNDIMDLGKKPISELNYFKSGINYIAPGQTIKFVLTSMLDDFEKKKNICIKINVRYKDKNNNLYQETFSIDFSEYLGILQLSEPPMYKIAKNIEKLQADFHRISTGFSKLKTIVYTQKEIDEGIDQLLKDKNEIREKGK